MIDFRLPAALALFIVNSCYAAPTGMSVVSGGATQLANSNTLQVNTTTQGTILNWQDFSIAAGETVNFNQPTAASTVLNRVLGSNPSQIYGQLSSNGQVWLINPSGILVGSTGRIDTAGFLASTLPILDSDALAGNWNFNGNASSGSIDNNGSITISNGGSVYFIAPNINNSASGIINAPNGQIMLLAGHTVTLSTTASPGVFYAVSAPDTQAVNLGSLMAKDILLQANVVRNGGQIAVNSIVQNGGRIFLRATKSATLDAGATLKANGTAGGVVAMAGVTVTANGSISATGSSGMGGSVLMSGTPDIGQSSAFDVSGTSAGSIITGAFSNEFNNGSANGWMVSNGWSNGGFFNSVWQSANALTSGGQIQLSIAACATNCLSMPYTSGEAMSLSKLGYGSYSSSIKAAKGSGVVTSFFTYNANPWDEIDIEILGKDTTKVQFNYFKNGVGGHEQIVNLGFDASTGFHQYSFTWASGNISWYVDGTLKHQVSGNNLPSTPGRAMINLWPSTGVDAWTGAYSGTAVTANYDYVRYVPSTSSLPSIMPQGLSANFSVPAPAPTPTPAPAPTPTPAPTPASIAQNAQYQPILKKSIDQTVVATIRSTTQNNKHIVPVTQTINTASGNTGEPENVSNCTQLDGIKICTQ